MNPRNTPLSFEEKEEIRRVYLETGNQQKVARITRHSTTTVWKVLKSYGLNKGQGGNQHYSITDEQILKGIADGLTRQEIADKYGTHVENLAKRMRKLGVHAKYATRSCDVKANIWHYSDNGQELVEKYQPDFEFIAYRRKKYKIKCKTCGNVVIRNGTSIRKNKCRCEKCKEILRLEKECERTRSFFIGEYKECECCGKKYFTQYKTTLYCSDACKRKAKVRRKERDPEYRKAKKKYKTQSRYIARAKKYGCQYEYGITIKSVYKRDDGICKICGKPCDINDKTYGDFGPFYPSVDHIIPLSKGGSHTWDNVQLAHVSCNSYKRDLTR